jgi:hypothetical protein
VHDIAWKCAYTSVSSYTICCTHVILFNVTTLMKRMANEECGFMLMFMTISLIKSNHVIYFYISLIKVKSCNIFLHMLLVCICSYIFSVLRYTFLIFYAYCIYIIKDKRICGCFSKAEGVSEHKCSENTVLEEKKVHINCVMLQLTKK